MNSTLLLLCKLRARAAWRKLRRAVSTPKGALLGLFSLGFLALMIVPNLVIAQTQTPIMTNLWFVSPPALFGFWLFIVAMGRNTGSITFSLAEVEFLFPGPFSRRQLLAYKLLLGALAPLGNAILIPIFLWRFAIWTPAVMLGFWLTFVFVQMTSLLFTLVVDWLSERFTRWRTIGLAVLAVLVLFSFWQAGVLEAEGTPLERIAALESAWPVQVILAPFAAFSHVARATTAAQLALWSAVALAINAATVLLIFRMDANFLQASLAASQKRYAWLERAKRGGGIPALSQRSNPRFGLRPFPRVAGAGPIAWRQLLELMRNSGRLLYVLPAILAMLAPVLLVGRHGSEFSAIGMMVMVGFMMSMMMPMGLRTDLLHIEVFKSLPITSGAIVWGSITSAVFYPTVVQVVAVAVLSAIGGEWTSASTLAVCFAMPLNLLLVSADSILVLLYPSTRQFVPGDFQLGMRLMFTYLAKILLVAVAAGVAGALVLIVYWILGESHVVMATAAWVTLMIEGALAMTAASLLFERFDPSSQSLEES